MKMSGLRSCALNAASGTIVLASLAAGQAGPSVSVRSAALRSLVYVSANGCSDGSARAGRCFALDAPSKIVTAHHVVGGCSTITVEYESPPSGAPKSYTASVRHVYSAGDLAILSVSGAPAVPVLTLAPPPPNRGASFAALGYQNGQLSAGDLAVTFSVGNQKLDAILTPEILAQLNTVHSPIDFKKNVLRFNTALQPGMSGGPIIDDAGKVIGIVAGGLKAGAAPASWGWPSEWLTTAEASTEPVGQAVRVTGAYYTLSDLRIETAAATDARALSCGTLTLTYRGTKTFADIRPGADDIPRLDYIVGLSMMTPAEINALRFDIWADAASGATAVMPAGYPLHNVGGVCVATSSGGTFTQVAWEAPAPSQMDIQIVSQQFEQTVMGPRVPFAQFAVDPALTTFIQPNIPGPQFRPNGLVFNRKGYIHYQFGTPAHSFETLIARSGTFLGVGTINRQEHPQLTPCMQSGAIHAPACSAARAHLLEWTHFILATQLSTYSVY